MINEVQKTERYEIPKSDTIYRNKDPDKVSMADESLYEMYIGAFLKGSRKIHNEDMLNISDGYRLFQTYLIKEKRLHEDRSETVNQSMRRLKEKFLKLWDIKLGFDQPVDPNAMDLSDAEIEEWRDEVVEKDKHGGIEEIKFQRLAVKLAKKYRFVYRLEFDEFLFYDINEGFFNYGATGFIAKKVRDILGEASTTHIVNEVVAYIRDLSLASEEEFTPTSEFINLKNGVLNWRDLRLLPHSPDYHFRTVLPFNYNVHARYSRFFEVLEEITKDDLNKALKVMEAYAWPFIDGYPIQKAIAFFGPGNDGKTVLLSVLAKLLGDGNISATSIQTLCNNRFVVPELRGKLANISGDVSDATLYDTSVFKQLTGGDLVEGEIKGMQRRPRFRNTAKMVFALNRLPNTWDQSRAYFRRFELIELIQDFTDRDDKKLTERITKEEDLQAIFNMIVEVFLPVLSSKLEFHNHDTTEGTTRRYKLNSNPSLAFIEEMLEPSPDKEIETKELYSIFSRWCNTKGISLVSSESFGNTLLKHSEMAIYRHLKQKDGTRKYYYIGVGIKDISPEDPKSDQGLEKGTQTMITFTEAVNYYIKTYKRERSDHGDLGFHSPRTCNLEYSIRVQKASEPSAPKKRDADKSSLGREEVSSDHAFERKNQTLITSHKDITKDGSLQSLSTKNAILELIAKLSNGKKGARISPSVILENLLRYNDDIVLSLNDLNEKVLPSMAAEGVISISNGLIGLTGKKLKEAKPKDIDNQESNNDTRYILLSVLEDINFSATDGKDYYLHKGELAHIPEQNARILIQRKWAREVQGGDQK